MHACMRKLSGSNEKKNAIRLRRFITKFLPFFFKPVSFKEILHIQFAQLVQL